MWISLFRYRYYFYVSLTFKNVVVDRCRLVVYLVDMESQIKCLFCDKTFTQRKSLYIHCRKFHDTDILPVKPFQCENCNTKFSNKRTLTVHINNFHRKSVQTKQTRIICPLDSCKEELITFVKQRKHLCEKHDIEVEFEEINFCGILGNNFIIKNEPYFFCIFSVYLLFF